MRTQKYQSPEKFIFRQSMIGFHVPLSQFHCMLGHANPFAKGSYQHCKLIPFAHWLTIKTTNCWGIKRKKKKSPSTFFSTAVYVKIFLWILTESELIVSCTGLSFSLTMEDCSICWLLGSIRKRTLWTEQVSSGTKLLLTLSCRLL